MPDSSNQSGGMWIGSKSAIKARAKLLRALGWRAKVAPSRAHGKWEVRTYGRKHNTSIRKSKKATLKQYGRHFAQRVAKTAKGYAKSRKLVKRGNPKITGSTLVRLPVSALRKMVKAVKRGESAVVRAVRVR